MSDDDLTKDIVASIPILRSYAFFLTKSAVQADDLVQDALERAWRHRANFRSRAALKPWLFSILRHRHIDQLRKERLTVQDVDGGAAATLISPPDQHWRVQYSELLRAIDGLPPKVREPLLLVIGGGLSHQEAAAVLGCPLGTLKSRIRRALNRLPALVDIDVPALGRGD